MTRRTLVSTVALGLLLAVVYAAAAQDLATQVNGVWKLTEGT